MSRIKQSMTYCSEQRARRVRPVLLPRLSSAYNYSSRAKNTTFCRIYSLPVQKYHPAELRYRTRTQLPFRLLQQ